MEKYPEAYMGHSVRDPETHSGSTDLPQMELVCM